MFLSTSKEQMIAQCHSRTLFRDRFAGKKRAEDRKLETPKDDPTGWSVACELVWFSTDEARQYARSRSAALQNARKSLPNIEGVFGLARCMAENRAFIARQGNREKGTVFVGYEQVLPDYRGMVLLDATADIDGLNELSPWRRPMQIPKATYGRLDIVHVPSVAEGTLKQWLQTKEHRREFETDTFFGGTNRWLFVASLVSSTRTASAEHRSSWLRVTLRC